MVMSRTSIIIASLAIACAGPAGPGPDTGLQGAVRYGPIQPVCHEGQPCDAPLQAGFDVERAGLVVARFQSDADGRFEVRLLPGTYVVIPDASAPVMQPRLQRREVVVGPVGLTVVELAFDTGIR